MTRAAAGGKDNLTGVWQGLYSYLTIVEPVSFMTTLIDSGGSVNGAVTELHDVGNIPPATLTALLSGGRSDKAVHFVKTYDGSSGWTHSVEYHGTMNAEATEIEGTWLVDSGNRGRFLMVRSPGKTQAVTRMATADA